MNNDLRRQLIEEAKKNGYQGSYVDLFRQATTNPEQFGMHVASNDSQKQMGLRPMHAQGRTDASMAFPDTPAHTKFNTIK